MRVRVVLANVTPAHVTLRVFVNGASAGLLTLTADEAPPLCLRLLSDTGKVTPEAEQGVSELVTQCQEWRASH